ncbi:MAG TPA: hypothetical protein VK772_06925 [Puia sp.]|nr:hypothetical protein [Puia sp.]
MKTCLCCLFAIFGFLGSAKAQSDIQAMLKQIAKLEIYIVDLEKGYKIAQEGLTTIGEIKKAEFNLHSLFFSSLESVNPSVAKYSKIAVLISDQLSIISAFKSLIQKINSSGKLTNSEIQYVQSVYSNLSDESTKTLNSLIAVLKDGTFEMTDDERIKRIDVIYNDMEDKYAFSQNFCTQTNQVCLLRTGKANELELLKILE